MNKNLKKSCGTRNGIKNKYIFLISNIKEKIGDKNLKKIIIALKVLNAIFAFIGFVASVITIVSFFCESDESIALGNYQKGIIYFEDGYFEEAKQCFEKAYKINNNLLDIKFYYANTEYILKNYDESYKILEENRNTLNADELALYAMYEYSKGNYRKSSEYLNKIQQPENLKVASFVNYITTSTELSFLNDYSEGVSTLYANITLLEAKINEAQQLPSVKKIFHVEDYDKELTEIQAANEVVERINVNALNDVLMLKKCKVCTYMQFISHSVQYGEYVLPVYILIDAAESVEFLTNYDLSIKYLEVLFYYTIGMEFGLDKPEEVEKACKIIVEKYKQIKLLEKQEGITIFNEEDRGNLEALEAILLDLENNCMNRNKYELSFVSEGDSGTYELEDIMKLWAEAFLKQLYIEKIPLIEKSK